MPISSSAGSVISGRVSAGSTSTPISTIPFADLLRNLLRVSFDLCHLFLGFLLTGRCGGLLFFVTRLDRGRVFLLPHSIVPSLEKLHGVGLRGRTDVGQRIRLFLQRLERLE